MARFVYTVAVSLMSALLLLVAAPAFALVDTASPVYRIGNSTYSTPEAACVAAGGSTFDFVSLDPYATWLPAGYCNGKWKSDGNPFNGYASYGGQCPVGYSNNAGAQRCEQSVSQCPDGKYDPGTGVCTPVPTCSGGQVWGGTSCQCPSGQTLVNGTCQVPCTAGQTLLAGYFDMGESPIGWPQQMSICSGTCQYNYDGTVLSNTALVNGVKHYFGQGKYTSTGASCNAPTNPLPGPATPQMPPDTCPSGYDVGTVNGKHYCAPRPGTSPASAPTNGNGDPVNPYGVGPTNGPTTTTSPPVTNPDGSTTQTTTVTNPDGSTTITTTTTQPNGGSTTTTKTTPGSSNSGGSGSSTGKGTGTGGNGTGGDSGACDADPSSQLCNPTANIGDIYTKKDKTFASVFAANRDAFLATPTGTAVGGFFNVSGGGACPTPSALIPWINVTLTWNLLCQGWGAAALAVAHLVLLVVAAFGAFRVAVE